MASKAWRAFNESADDIRRLLEIHSTLGGPGQGRRYKLEVLNKSSIVLITAIWEAYCEDIAAEALDLLVANVSSAAELPLDLRKRIATELKRADHELAVWDLADEGWKDIARSRLAALTAERNRKLNTPKAASIDDLFETAIGLKSISSSWHWHRMTADRAKAKLDKYIELRGAIAHRGKSATSCKKVEAEDFFDLATRLANRTGGKVRAFLKEVTGKRLF